MKEKNRVMRQFKRHNRKGDFWCKIGIAAEKHDNRVANKIRAIAVDRINTEILVIDIYLKGMSTL